MRADNLESKYSPILSIFFLEDDTDSPPHSFRHLRLAEEEKHSPHARQLGLRVLYADYAVDPRSNPPRTIYTNNPNRHKT